MCHAYDTLSNQSDYLSAWCSAFGDITRSLDHLGQTLDRRPVSMLLTVHVKEADVVMENDWGSAYEFICIIFSSFPLTCFIVPNSTDVKPQQNKRAEKHMPRSKYFFEYLTCCATPVKNRSEANMQKLVAKALVSPSTRIQIWDAMCTGFRPYLSANVVRIAAPTP